jgi:hypothetical protein
MDSGHIAQDRVSMDEGERSRVWRRLQIGRVGGCLISLKSVRERLAFTYPETGGLDIPMMAVSCWPTRALERQF